MMTWRLWNAVRWPFVGHPLYGRLIAADRRRVTLRPLQPRRASIFSQSSPLWPVWGFVAGVGLVFALFSGGWMLLIPLICFAPLFVVGVGTLLGLNYAIRTAGVIAGEKQAGRYELLSLAPWGAAGLGWAACSAIYHNNPMARSLRSTAQGLYGLAAVGAVWLVGAALLTYLTSAPTRSALDFTVVVVLLLFMFDLVQSSLLGCTVGMLAPTLTQTPLDARGLAFGGFLAVQMLSYAVLGLFSIAVLPLLFPTSERFTLALMQLIVVGGGRDLLLNGLWRLLAARLETSPKELSAAAGLDNLTLIQHGQALLKGIMHTITGAKRKRPLC